MCLILDANVVGNLFANPTAPDHAPVFDWLRDGGRIVTGGRNLQELQRVESARRQLREWKRAGRLHEEPRARVEAEEARIREGCHSDDPHVIALARTSLARTLFTEDRDLMRDFKDRHLVSGPRGSIYRGSKHRRLLRHTRGCPGRRR